mgnify:CR=1 FL=1
MKPEVKQAFEMMSKGECPCHAQIQAMPAKHGMRQDLAMNPRRGYADPRWPDVPPNYEILVRNIKNKPALFAFKRRADGSWDVDPMLASEEKAKLASGHRVVKLGAGQVLGVERTTLEVRLFG